jgi:hypothetical protein
MDLNRSLSDNYAENKALRAMVAHAKDDTMKHLSLSKEKIHAQIKGLTAALRQISEAAQLPPANMLWEMTEDDIEFRKKLVARAITQYENHTSMPRSLSVGTKIAYLRSQRSRTSIHRREEEDPQRE